MAEHRGVLYGIWGPSQYQGMIAGMVLAGQAAEFAGMAPANTLKVLGLDLFSAGTVNPPDGSCVVIEDEAPDAVAGSAATQDAGTGRNSGTGSTQQSAARNSGTGSPRQFAACLSPNFGSQIPIVYRRFLFQDARPLGAVLLGDTACAGGFKSALDAHTLCADLLAARPTARDVAEHFAGGPTA